MKTTFYSSVALFFCLLLAGCFPDDIIGPDGLKQKKGKVVFEIKDDPREPIKLTSARTTNEKEHNGGYVLTFSQNGNIITQIDDFHNGDDIEMPVGTYDVSLKSYFMEEKGDYTGKLAASGFETVEVTEGETRVSIIMTVTYMYITIVFDNMPDAVAWIGEEGFEPSEANKVRTPSELLLVETDNFEVVVEFEGQRKRYTATANRSSEYTITITNDSDEPTDPAEKSDVHISYELSDLTLLEINWKW